MVATAAPGAGCAHPADPTTGGVGHRRHGGGAARALRLVPRLGHASEPVAVAISADARVLASAGESGLIKIWDASTAVLLRTIRGYDTWVYSIALSRDGSRLVATPETSTTNPDADVVTVWDTATGKLIRSFPGGGAVRATPDGGAFLLPAKGGGLVLRDASTLEERQRFATKGYPWRLAFDATGRRLLTVAGAPEENHVLKLWDVSNGALLQTFRGHTAGVTGVGFIGADRILSASTDKTLRTWDAKTGAAVRSERSPKAVLEMAVSADGRWAVTDDAPNKPAGIACDDSDGVPCDDGTTTIWSTVGAVAPRTLNTWHQHPVFFPDGTRVFSGVTFVGNHRSDPDNLRTWDVRDTDDFPTSVSFDPGIRPVHDLAFSTDGKRLIHTGVGSIWDLSTLSRVAPTDVDQEDRVALADDGRVMSGRYLWDKDFGYVTETLMPADPKPRPDRSKNCEPRFLRILDLAPSRRRALLLHSNEDAGVYVCDLATGAGKEVTDWATALAISADGSVGVTDAALWDLDHATKIRDLAAPPPKDLTRALAISADKRRVVGLGDETIRVWDASTGKLLRSIPAPHTPAPMTVSETDNKNPLGRHLAISPDGRLAALAPGTAMVEIFDLDSGAHVRTLAGHSDTVDTVAFSPDGRLVASGSEDGTVRLFRLDNGGSVALAASPSDWVVYSDDGYFDASRNGGSLLGAVDGLHAYLIDQLALTRDRPDLLLSRMGLGSPALVAHFRARYDHRLRKVGLRDDDAALGFDGAPTARITSAKVSGRVVELGLALEAARGGELARYGIFVDDVPIFGALGKTTSGARQSLVERVELIEGRNKIEVDAFDDAGVESLRDVRYIDGPAGTKGELYYLGFGVSRYQDARLNLGYAHKDALDLGATFAKMKGEVFADVHTKVIVNEQATKASIASTKDFFRVAKADDTVVLFIAGHGVHTRDAAADYFYATFDVNVSDVRGTGAPFELIEGLLDGIAPRKKLFLMDTCQSGELDDDDPHGTPTAAGARGMASRALRGLVFDDGSAKKPMAVPSPARALLFDRDRYVYNDLTRRTGAIVFSSSRGVESSYEEPAWGNGAFTAELLSGFSGVDKRSTLVTVDALREYVTKAVATRTRDLQHPTVDRDNLEIKFGFPAVR